MFAHVIKCVSSSSSRVDGRGRLFGIPEHEVQASLWMQAARDRDTRALFSRWPQGIAISARLAPCEVDVASVLLQVLHLCSKGFASVFLTASPRPRPQNEQLQSCHAAAAGLLASSGFTHRFGLWVLGYPGGPPGLLLLLRAHTAPIVTLYLQAEWTAHICFEHVPSSSRF